MAKLDEKTMDAIIGIMEYHRREAGDLETSLRMDEQVYLSLLSNAQADPTIIDTAPHDIAVNTIDTNREINGDLRADVNVFYGVADSTAASLMPGRPTVDVRATLRTLIPMAEARTALVNSTFDSINMYLEMKCAVLCTFMHGLCFLGTTWSPARSAPLVEHVRRDDLWFDPCATRWENVRYVVRRKEMALSDLKSNKQFNQKVVASLSGTLNRRLRPGQPAKAPYPVVTVYEMWYFAANMMVIMADSGEAAGAPVLLAAGGLPYVGKESRNPFRPLTFNFDLYTAFAGVSDAKLARSAARQLDILSMLDVAFKRANIPVPVVNETMLSDRAEFEEAYAANPSPNKVIMVRLPPNTPVTSLITTTPTPQLPADFDQTIRRVWETLEFVLAMPSYMRGATNNGTVATEFVLADKSLTARNEQRFQARNGVIAACARQIVELYEQFMDDDEIIPLGVTHDTGDFKDRQVSRETLGFVPKAEALGLMQKRKHAFYLYNVEVFDRADVNPTTMLRALAQVIPMMQGNPNVDQRMLVRIVAKAVGEPHLLLDKEAMAKALQAATGAAAPAPGDQQGTAPEGLDPASLPPEQQGAFTGGQAMPGTATGMDAEI